MTTSSWHEGKKRVFEHFDLEVISFNSHYSAGLADISRISLMSGDDLVLSNCMTLNLETTILAPNNKAGQTCAVQLLTTKPHEWESMRVSDIQIKEEDGQPQFETKDKRLVPVINDVFSIGYLNRNYRQEGWRAFVHLPVYVVRDFQFALVNGLAPYVCLNFMRIEKSRMIKTIQYDSSEAYNDNR
ncbi:MULTISPECIES: hypothetical protein [Halomonadaceae]|uniref:Uncharacterized protein n=1 Tax=Vreelandella alkaliphila TaxID=272774 RepID=A0AAJ2RXP7_9GAMM|nr:MULTISPECIES: hypothetical protein [Halomonas]MDX5976216.1 hypothetical protein [Halomonas alkaliphila]